MAEKSYKVASYPVGSDKDLQQLLRHLSTSQGDHTITHLVIDPDRPADKRLIVVRLKDPASG